MDIDKLSLDYETEPYTVILQAFDWSMQFIMAIEEMSELTKEITKALRGYSRRDNVIEEIADVEIMLAQLKVVLGVTDGDVDKEKKRKLDRLKPAVMQRLEKIKATQDYYDAKN